MKSEEDDPKSILKRLIKGVKEEGWGEETQMTFSKVRVKALLLETIETPKAM